jgi:integrase
MFTSIIARLLHKRVFVAFGHSHASILYFAGVDSVSISKRLGHSKVSTTSDIYSHIIKEADERSAECVAEAIYRNKKA